MNGYSDALGNLVEQLAKLPGIGRKSAQRLAFHILKKSDKEARLLAEAILEAKEKIHYCSLCYNLTDRELCARFAVIPTEIVLCFVWWKIRGM